MAARTDLPGATVWLTGLSGSGKSTFANAVAEQLLELDRSAYVLDGDNVRHGLNADLGFSAADRAENVRRIGEVARLMADAGLVVLVPVICPYRADRDARPRAPTTSPACRSSRCSSTRRSQCASSATPKASTPGRGPELTGMTGIDDPYEPPLAPELHLRPDDLASLAARVVDAV